ncbi:MAG TPA: hypothetical protein VE818_02140 [Nitrososphaeraceae archaeon]|nr:hypothetical protein [Nitrososphaeraceae archaeon]
MKRFSQFNLKKLILLFVTVVVIILLYHSFPVYYYDALHVQAQLQQLPQPSLQQQSPPIIGIKITSPTTGQQVPVGQLTISGRSTDNPTTDCTVYADWNNLKPFQKAIATGPGGVNDYSTWNYTYTNNYHLITNGTNELTSKLSCISSPTNLTKFYSVNLIGIATMTNNKTGATSAEEVQQQSPTIDNTTSTTNVILDNRTETVVEERLRVNDNISSPTSIPVPLVANDFAFDRVNVNITSPKSGQQVPVGNLTIAGHSSDNPANDCIVYTNWNGQNPLQIAKALGPGGVNDYSTWSFTYTPAYHAIINGTNELTAQISCLDGDSNNNNNNKTNNTATYLTNYYRVNVTGITEASSSERTTSSEEQKEQTNSVGSSAPIPTPSPVPSSPPSTQKQEEEDKDVEKEEPEPEPQPEAEPEPEPEPQPTTPLTEEDDDKTEDADEEEGNTVKQEKKVKEIQEEDKVQEQLKQMLEKAGKINEEVQQKVDKAKEDILEEIKKGFK